jgi:hypothetical protein
MFEFILIPFNNLIGKTPIFCKRNKCKNVVYYSEYENIENNENIKNMEDHYCSKACKEYTLSNYNVV